MANLPKKSGKKTRLSMLRDQGTVGIGALPQMSSGTLVVDIDLLVEDPENERKTFNEKELNNLASSIKDVGIIEPITVTPHGDEQYMILAGHRRHRAAKRAGLKKVQIVVASEVDGADRRKRSIISNIQREDIPPLELAKAIKSVLEETGMRQRDLAGMIGKAESWVSERLRILKLSEAAQTQLSKGAITQSSVDALARISRLSSNKDQVRLVQALENGASNREIRAKIDKIDPKKGRGGKKPKAKTTSKTITLPGCRISIRFEPGKKADFRKALADALKQLEE